MVSSCGSPALVMATASRGNITPSDSAASLLDLTAVLQGDLDQIRAARTQAGSQRLGKLLAILDAHALDAHATCQRHPVEIGTIERKHVDGARTGILDTDVGQLSAQDVVGSVGK